jgi:hypothetical protein
MIRYLVEWILLYLILRYNPFINIKVAQALGISLILIVLCIAIEKILHIVLKKNKPIIIESNNTIQKKSNDKYTIDQVKEVSLKLDRKEQQNKEMTSKDLYSLENEKYFGCLFNDDSDFYTQFGNNICGIMQ